ncbi:MAG: hypothetical protein GY754_15735 [bacterium]|nr:hypothetical protein [bacterium]
MKNNKSTDDIQLTFNFSNGLNTSSELFNKTNNVVTISDHINNKNRIKKFEAIERIISLSDHLYK